MLMYNAFADIFKVADQLTDRSIKNDHKQMDNGSKGH